MKEEKERLIKHYQEQIESLKKALEMLSNEYQKKSSTDKDKININNFHANNIIALSAFEEGARGQAKKTELDYEMKLLEIESRHKLNSKCLTYSLLATLKSQLIQKNKTIVEMNNQTSEMARELRRRDDRIFDLENQMFFLRAQTPLKP